MDSGKFDATRPWFVTHLTRRRSLGLLGALGTAGIWGVGDAGGKNKRKKRPRKCYMVGYAVCVDGETILVNSCGRKKLLKRGATRGPCPEDCVPLCMDCNGGDDGCGGTCSCPDGQTCINATCKEPQ